MYAFKDNPVKRKQTKNKTSTSTSTSKLNTHHFFRRVHDCTLMRSQFQVYFYFFCLVKQLTSDNHSVLVCRLPIYIVHDCRASPQPLIPLSQACDYKLIFFESVSVISLQNLRNRIVFVSRFSSIWLSDLYWCVLIFAWFFSDLTISWKINKCDE